MKSDVARLCLGTAPYTLKHDKQKIVDCAWEAGIEWLDTAVDYGGYHRAWKGKKITKLKASHLAVASFHLETDVILTHEPKAEHLVRAIKAAGYKGKIGQSVYWPETINPWAEVVQFPLSLADRRYMEVSSWTKKWRLSRGDVELITFARSIFLQGKLLEMGYSVSDCLGYVLRQPVDYAVVGVNSVKELE